MRTLAVVMQALPAPLAFSSINLVGCGLTAGNALLLAKSMREGFQQTASLSMKELYVGSNPDLGDEGLTALAGALPNTLESLFLDNTGCGDRAMATIATALPDMPGVQKLELQRNPAVSKVGWAALGNALPMMQVRQHWLLESKRHPRSSGWILQDQTLGILASVLWPQWRGIESSVD